MEISESMAAFQSTPGLLEKIQSFGIQKDYKAGTIILSENAPIRSIPIVLSGSLKVFKTDDEDREILLYYIKSGESCIMSVSAGMHQENMKVKAEVEEDATILFLPLDKVTFLIHEYPQWLAYILHAYHKRFEELLQVVNDIAFKKMDERLFDLLHKKTILSHQNTILITHEQLAHELGTVRVVISRLLKQLEENGKVVLGRNKIILTEKEKTV